MQVFAFLKDKKRLAWSLLSVLKNNIVTPLIYYLLILVEYTELILLYLVFAFSYYSDSQGYWGDLAPTY